MSLLIKNIHRLLCLDHAPDAPPPDDAPQRRFVAGKAMADMHALEDAWLLCENGRIAAFGRMADQAQPQRAEQVINAQGKLVLPSFCDSHTHLVFATARAREYVDRIQGLSYEQIAANGGGILNSAKRLRETPEEELLESAWRRIGEIADFGTGAVEIKSGYGLDTASELKMLRVARKLAGISPVAIKTTFLGAHAVPPEFAGRQEAYVDYLIEDTLPKVAEEGLADYIDAFCDRGFFTPESTDRLLEAGARYGLKPKIHANELDYSGGIQVGVQHGAVSVDHLECTGPEEIAVLKDSATMPTLLPSTAFFLGLEYPPARRMIDAGLPVALASDYNPGSSPSGRMAFVLALACAKMGMLPSEALHAATLNGARALEWEVQMGSIAVGKRANLIVTRPMDHESEIPYWFGRDPVESAILGGQLR